jgi:hypothetical protein
MKNILVLSIWMALATAARAEPFGPVDKERLTVMPSHVIIPKIEFADITCVEALEFLRYKTHDMDNGPTYSHEYRCEPDFLLRRITYTANNITMRVVLDRICAVAGISWAATEASGEAATCDGEGAGSSEGASGCG